MADRITANLPARDFDATAAFYEKLGFVVDYRDVAWMIMRRGPLELEFFPYPDLDPAQSSFSACLRSEDVDVLYAAFVKAGLPGGGIPRLTPPMTEPFGLRFFALVDLDGSLLRCIDNHSTQRLSPRT